MYLLLNQLLVLAQCWGPNFLAHYEINPSRVKLKEKLGSGVFKATYRVAFEKATIIAVRMLPDHLSSDDFFQEAKMMMLVCYL